jgi:predicted acylesterase/phospholipase RssA
MNSESVAKITKLFSEYVPFFPTFNVSNYFQGVAESGAQAVRSNSAIFGRDEVSYENIETSSAETSSAETGYFREFQRVAEYGAQAVRSNSAIFGRDEVSYENPSDVVNFKELRSTACAKDVANPQFSGETKSCMKMSPRPQKPCATTIKHLVIAGGGDYGFAFYSALSESHRDGFWNIHNIKTMYGTSIGSLIVVCLALAKTISFDMYDDFMLNRPWHKVFDFHLRKILQLVKEKGVFNKKLVEVGMSPVFNAVDIPMDITMADYYRHTNIEIHLMVSNMTTLELMDVSYKTCPDWKVLDAIYASMGLPVLFEPYVVDGNVYADGGFINNFPVNICIDNGAIPDEILGVVREPTQKHAKVSFHSLVDYLYFIIGRLLSTVSTPYTTIKNQILFSRGTNFINIYDIYRSTSHKESRAKLFEDGRVAWNTFYDNLEKRDEFSTASPPQIFENPEFTDSENVDDFG